MLKFIFGRPSSGKTSEILKIMKELHKNGEGSILIVPEQFSFEAEKRVLSEIGDSFALSSSVMSFSRVCDEVASVCGGTAAKVLEDSDKIILMKRALNLVKENLILWRKYSASVSFAQSIIDVISELKINAVTSAELRRAANEIDSVALKNKLLDIAEIYDSYDLVLGERFIDPLDKLTLLYRQLEEYKLFENKTVFIDSFKGFTGQQFKIIGRILAQAKDVYITFNFEENSPEYSIYDNIGIAVEKIKKLASNNGVQILEPIKLYENKCKQKSLEALERLLAGEDVTVPENDGSITVCKCANVNDEARFAARTIRRLVREEGMRYRDFVIIARNTEDYEEAVELACKRAGIGCFTDRRLPLSAFPVCVAAFAAIGAVKSFTTEKILRFYKTGITELNTDEVSLIENYTAVWNINGEMWLNEWDMNVRGLVTDEPRQSDITELEKINNIRKKIISPLCKFKEEYSGNAKSRAAAIVNLFKNCRADQALKSLSNDFNNNENNFSADTIKQSYSQFMDVLNSITECFLDAQIKSEEFEQALEFSVKASSIGTIPQTLDEVTFGSAERIRPSRPKVAFILGANHGKFPANIVSSGLLSVYEREQIIAKDILIADNAISSVIDENHLVYTSLCCASEKLFVSYSVSSLTGEVLEPSIFIDKIMQNIPVNKSQEPSDELDDTNLPETSTEAVTVFCENYQFNEETANAVKNALNLNGDNDKLAQIEEALNRKKESITKQNAKDLYGSEMRMSASRLDVFNRCRFSYFCKYGLNLKKLQKADFDVLQRGTIVHYVFERLIIEKGEDISALSKEDISSLVDKYIEEYLDSVNGYRSIETAHSRFLISRISRLAKEVAEHIVKEFAQSKFKPYKCEMKIAQDGDIPEQIIPFDEGNIHLIGSIDRVDKYGSYIRIIDYKTGSRSFKLPDILFGLNLQMLIYLYSAVRGMGIPDENAAGIFYLQSKRDLNESGMAMNGLLQGNLDLVTAMDKDNSGEFVPKISFTKDGGVSKSLSSFISAEDFTTIFDYLEKIISKAGNDIISGDISINPVDGRESAACDYCDFASLCAKEDREALKVPKLSNSAVISKIKEGEDNGV